MSENYVFARVYTVMRWTVRKTRVDGEAGEPVNACYEFSVYDAFKSNSTLFVPLWFYPNGIRFKRISVPGQRYGLGTALRLYCSVKSTLYFTDRPYTVLRPLTKIPLLNRFPIDRIALNDMNLSIDKIPPRLF